MLHDGQCVGCTPTSVERATAPRLEISRRQLQQFIADGVLIRLRRGVVVGSCLVEQAASDRRLAHRLQVEALLLTYADAVASHQSAAVVLGLPLLVVPPQAIATRESGSWRSSPNGRIRISPLPSHHRRNAIGPRCTTAARTFIDIAKSATFREAVIVGDAVIRDHCDAGDIDDVLFDCAPWADIAPARRALAFLDHRSESALESVSRVIMHERNLPLPELQVTITVGRMSYRVDFLWKAHRLIGEADGMIKYDEPGSLRAEKVRQEKLEQLGYRFVRWTWREMLAETDETVTRIRSKLVL
jgi:very-short-patch-repair endonuclease